MNTSQLYTGLQSLVIFRNLYENPVISALKAYLRAAQQSSEDAIGNYCRFVSALYERTENFSRYLLELVLEDENLYVKKYCSGEPVGEYLEDCLTHELAFLKELSGTSAQELSRGLNEDGFCPPIGPRRLISRQNTADAFLTFIFTAMEYLQNIICSQWRTVVRYR